MLHHLAPLLALLLMTSGCGDDAAAPLPDGGPPPDGGDIDGGPPRACERDGECDDGVFCNGDETCGPGGLCVNAPRACDDGIACTVDRCSEAERTCLADLPDLDMDGHGDAACMRSLEDPAGDDCDDTDAARYPGNREICDDEGHDEDCDPATHGDVDDDADGAESDQCCNTGPAGSDCGPDCDDARASVRPGGTEVCDGLDQDCNGTPDDGVGISGWVDADRDSYGDTSMPMTRCAGAAGFAVTDGDCNDRNVAVNPGQPEICDGIRNDCSALPPDMGAGAVDWFGDTDGDSFGSRASGVTRSCVPVPDASLLGTDCDDTVAAINPAAAEMCNGRDDDCNGRPDFFIGPMDTEDDDLDGVVDVACSPAGMDCNDRDPATGPGEAERCDARDNDCDTRIDEGATSIVFYRDLDGDGFGSAASGSIVACMASAGFVARGGDCNDADVMRYPGATEHCDRSDDDCDAGIDETPAELDCPVFMHATSSVCDLGTCRVGTCVDGREDCNGRSTDGCEAHLGFDRNNCGGCGRACDASDMCVDGACVCALRCSGSCVDPMTDERYCGALSRCTAFNTCSSHQICNSGVCSGSALFPGGIDHTMTGMGFPHVRPMTFQIDTPLTFVDIEYTLDGSSPITSATRMVAAPPVNVMLADGQTVRWRALYSDGSTEVVRDYTQRVNLTARTTPGVIAENLTLNGQGAYLDATSGALINGMVDLQRWNLATPMTVSFGIEIDTGGGGQVIGCVTTPVGAYPGATTMRLPLSGTAPSLGGTYPIRATLTFDTMCMPSFGTGEIVGYVHVRPTFLP